MDKETIIIASEDVKIIDASEYKEELSEHFGRVPEVAKPLLKGAKTVFSQIEKSLYTAPAFINAVNMAKSGMNLKTLQYIMGHADISVTLNTYTHVKFDDAKDELLRVANA